MEDPGGQIHREHPFQTPLEQRDPVLRLRGRLARGVTIWTSEGPDGPVGLTVSSVLVAEGTPSLVIGLINDTTGAFDAIGESHGFVVHVLNDSMRSLAERFAGVRPAPGGPFKGLHVENSEFGPALGDVTDRVYCRLFDSMDAGYQRLVRGAIERVELSDLRTPLIHFRGRYRSLDPPAED
ncbi:MAG: flavin reductase family protein [Actinomycetota bacterium]